MSKIIWFDLNKPRHIKYPLKIPFLVAKRIEKNNVEFSLGRLGESKSEHKGTDVNKKGAWEW